MEDKIVKVFGKEYKVSFPNVGQYYDIEAMKQSLGKGFYNTMLGNVTVSAQAALDMIDAEATITILMPDLVKDLKVDRFKDLGIKDYMQIKQLYDQEIFPFLKEVNKILNPPKTE